MLVGEVPFDAPSAAEFAARVERAAQRPPSTVVAGVPAAVDAVVQRCLEKRPERRFSSASELGEAAAAALAGQRPGFRKAARGGGLAPSPGRMMDGLRRHAVAVAAVAVIGALGVIGLALMPDRRESPPQPDARTRPTALRPPSGNQPVSISLLGGRAEVWVDGRQAGPTPCRFEAAVGDTIDVELRVPGYRPLQRSIEVLPHSNTYTYSIRDFRAR